MIFFSEHYLYKDSQTDEHKLNLKAKGKQEAHSLLVHQIFQHLLDA